MRGNRCGLMGVAWLVGVAGGAGLAWGGPAFVMESFEDGAAGESVPEGWVSRFPGGGTALSASETSEGELSMRMVGQAFSANENYTAQKYWFSAGTTTLSASIFVESFDPASDGCAGGTVGYFGPDWSVSFGVNQREPGGPLTLGRTDVEAQPGRWYHMVAVVEESGARASLFVNGVLVDPAQQVHAPAPGDVRHGSIFAHSGCTDTGSVVTYFDGIRIQGTQCVSDLNGDGVLDLTDISIFVGGFTAGCP